MATTAPMHGGLLGALIDESMGDLIFINHELYDFLLTTSTSQEASQAILANVINGHALQSLLHRGHERALFQAGADALDGGRDVDAAADRGEEGVCGCAGPGRGWRRVRGFG